MNRPFDGYRDDGPLARAIRAPSVPGLPSILLVAVGVCALGATLGTADRPDAPRVIVGVGTFVLFGILSRSATSSRLDFLVAALLRLGEYGAVTWVAWRTGQLGPPLLALLLVVGFHHYEVAYRWIGIGQRPPVWRDLAGLGWEGRTTLLVVAGATSILSPTLLVLTVWCGGWFVGESAAYWRRRSRLPDVVDLERI